MGFALRDAHQSRPQPHTPRTWTPGYLPATSCHPHLCLILPGDATQSSVQLQVFTSRELIKQGVELRAVAKALLYLEQVLEHTGDRGWSIPRTICSPHTCPLVPWGHGHHTPRSTHTPLHLRSPLSPAATHLQAVTDRHTHHHASLGVCRAQEPHLCPLTKASPPVVLSSPVSILKVLVFPAPLTPRSPKHSPGRTPRQRRSTARIRPIFRDLYTWPKSLPTQQRVGTPAWPGFTPLLGPTTHPIPHRLPHSSEPTLVRFSILTMSLSASPRSTL